MTLSSSSNTSEALPPAPAPAPSPAPAPAPTVELSVGCEFPTGKEAVHAAQDDALRRGKSVRVVRSSGADRRLECPSPGCGSYVQFYRRRSAAGKYGSWYLSSRSDEHAADCAAAPRPTRRQILASAAFRLAARAADASASEVIARVQERGGISLARHKRTVYRALGALHDRGLADARRSFALLPAYLSAFARLNPGSTAALETDGERRFKRAAVVAKAFADAAGARLAVLGVDCQASESLSFAGVQVRLVARDGNRQRFTAAFALLPADDADNMGWLFRQLVSAGFFLDGSPVVCAREAASVRAVAAPLGLPVKFCVRHLVAQLADAFGKAGFQPLLHAPLVWQLQAADTEASYRRALSRVRAEVSDAVADYLEAIDPQDWCVFANVGKASLFGQCTADLAPAPEEQAQEQENKQLRALAPFAFVQRMCEAMVSDCYRRSELAAAWAADGARVTAGARELLQQESRELDAYLVQHASRSLSYVHHLSAAPRVTRRVDLEAAACTCGFMDQHRAPCRHVLAVLQDRGALERDAWGFFHDCYSAASFASAFKDKAVCVPIESEVEPSQECLCPLVAPRRGRPARKHLRTGREGEQAARKMAYRCSTCGQSDHNKRRCPTREAAGNENKLK